MAVKAATLGRALSFVHSMQSLSRIHRVHIRDLDLNLLHVFQAVHEARSVSRAAERLGLSQPAASHALDAPLWLGEFPTATSSQSPVGIVSAARHAGYAGAFGWSLCADDRFSSAAGCYEAARYCRRSNSDPATGNPQTVPR